LKKPFPRRGTPIIKLNEINPYAIDRVVLYWYTRTLDFFTPLEIKYALPVSAQSGKELGKLSPDIGSDPDHPSAMDLKPRAETALLYQMAIMARVFGDAALERRVLYLFRRQVTIPAFLKQEQFLDEVEAVCTREEKENSALDTVLCQILVLEAFAAGNEPGMLDLLCEAMGTYAAFGKQYIAVTTDLVNLTARKIVALEREKVARNGAAGKRAI
jgi:hypothetical protein